MKKIFSFLLVITSFFLISCSNQNNGNNNQGDVMDQTEEKELILENDNLDINCGEKAKLPSTNYEVNFVLGDNDFAYIKDEYIYAVKEGKINIDVCPIDKDIKSKQLEVVVKKGKINKIDNFENDQHIKSLGRNEIKNGSITLIQNASSVEFSYVGSALKLNMYSQELGFGNPEYSYLVDDETDQNKHIVSFKGNKLLDIKNDFYGSHKVKILKRNEAKFTRLTIDSVETDGYFTFINGDKLKIEVYGDSITCGYAIYGEPYNNHNTNALDTYAYLTAKNLNADLSVFASSGIGLLKGETANNVINKFMYLHQNSNKKWDFSLYDPDIVIINLGTNDLWFGVSESEFYNAYLSFLYTLREIYNNAKFVCVNGMMTKDMNSAIKKAVNKFNDRSYFVDLPKANVKVHPLKDDHLASSEVLTKFIKENVL